VTYKDLSESMHNTAISILDTKVRICPDWFSANRNDLSLLIEKRNTAVFQKMSRPTRSSIKSARIARRDLKLAIQRAKSNWIKRLCDNVSLFAMERRIFGTVLNY